MPILSEEDLERFRTKVCTLASSNKCDFGVERCNYSHNLYWARRCPFYLRDSTILRYIPACCPDVELGEGTKVLKNTCPRGNNCSFAHSWEEINYHPLVYKTQVCKDYRLGKCRTYYCHLVHGLAEMRVPREFVLPRKRGLDIPEFEHVTMVDNIKSVGSGIVVGGGNAVVGGNVAGGNASVGGCRLNLASAGGAATNSSHSRVRENRNARQVCLNGPEHELFDLETGWSMNWTLDHKTGVNGNCQATNASGGATLNDVKPRVVDDAIEEWYSQAAASLKSRDLLKDKLVLRRLGNEMTSVSVSASTSTCTTRATSGLINGSEYSGGCNGMSAGASEVFWYNEGAFKSSAGATPFDGDGYGQSCNTSEVAASTEKSANVAHSISRQCDVIKALVSEVCDDATATQVARLALQLQEMSLQLKQSVVAQAQAQETSWNTNLGALYTSLLDSMDFDGDLNGCDDGKDASDDTGSSGSTSGGGGRRTSN